MGFGIPVDRAIRRFCGLPMAVIVLPMVTPRASVMRKTPGLIRNCLATLSMIGVAISANVSFTRNADIMLIPTSTRPKAFCGDFATRSSLKVRYSRSPERSIAATTENIPRRKKITLRLIDA